MHEDPTPLEVFVLQCFQKPQIVKIISGWRLDSAKLQAVVANNIRDLGISFVHRNQKKVLLDMVSFVLKRSKEIKAMIKAVESEENERRRSRHADV